MIVRVPIKIRKPVFLEYCTCFNQNTVSVEGEPQGIYVSEYEDAINILTHYPETVPLYVRNKLEESQVTEILAYGVPINLFVSSDLDYLEMVIKHLPITPYSGVTIEIEPDMDFTRLREILHVVKSNKIHIIGLVKFEPYIMSRVKLFGTIEKIKNYISHLLLDIPPVVTDEEYYEKSGGDEQSDKAIRHYYYADVPSRTWVLKEDAVDNLMGLIWKHLKMRKITVERIDFQSVGGRIRHQLGNSSLLFGIRPFLYSKHEPTGKFVRTTELKGCHCNKCEKPIFE